MLLRQGQILPFGQDVEIDGVVWSYASLTNMTKKDRAKLGITWQDPPVPPTDWVREARSALEASDRVAIRALKSGGSYPEAWQAYDDQLRAIVNGADGPLPPQPAYPE